MFIKSILTRWNLASLPAVFRQYYHAWHNQLLSKIIQADPERDVFKSAFRTAFACMVCMGLFHYVYTDPRVSLLAGFAAFSFVQNDPHGLPWPRFCFLSSTIIVLTGVSFMGLCLSLYPWFFLASIPLLAFGVSYFSCLGTMYFNAGVWALILYVFAGANPMSVTQAIPIVWVFFSCGVICIVTCFSVFPIRPYQRLLKNYRLIFKNFMAVLRSDHLDKAHLSKTFNHKIDHLLLLHQQNLQHYFNVCGPSLAQQKDFQEMNKLLYQIGLMLKSLVAFRKRIMVYVDYPQTQLDVFHHEMRHLLTCLMRQTHNGRLPHFAAADAVLEQCRDRLTSMRQEMLRHASVMHTPVDFTTLFDYSNYLYHIIQLYCLFKDASDNIAIISQHRLAR